MKKWRRFLRVPAAVAVGINLAWLVPGVASTVAPPPHVAPPITRISHAPSPHDDTTNLPQNGGFEAGMAPWTPYHATLALTSTAHSGSAALQVGPWAPGMGLYYIVDYAGDDPWGNVANGVVATQSGPYTATALVLGLPGRSLELELHAGTAGGIAGQVWDSIWASGGWQMLRTSLWVAAGNNIDVWIGQAGYSQGDYLLVDDVSLLPAGSAIPTSAPSPSPTAIASPSASATPILIWLASATPMPSPTLPAPFATEMPTATVPSTPTGIATQGDAPTATNTPTRTCTNTATNTPTSTLTATPTSVPSTRTLGPPQATSTSVKVATVQTISSMLVIATVPARPSATARATARSTPDAVPISVGVSPRRVASGGTLTLQVRTAPRLGVLARIEVVGTRARRTVVLYRLDVRGMADARGLFRRTVRITHRPVAEATATLTVSVQAPGRRAVKATRFTITPAVAVLHLPASSGGGGRNLCL